MIHKLFTSPINLIVKVGEHVKEEVDKEMYDLDHIQKKLVNLQMMYELDEISQDVYEAQEEELLERYEVAKRMELEQWEEMTKRR
ncbi:gas vesicle protein GvpG [Halobacillus halophilus]|uniref:Gas vesicle protein GvpG n=1 Tax=Halobacillus halophilus (strain ATCC 35676 / DSM 2266 / JCM 20832 / KCTC 3685 / LMG 17431 / NBRC 102448 / NCIMB 2269) TaxID=866895 RepID=I0JQQ4_HALH3|nr:gas vesicle protein GvpG [Halobacillus halophilus]ASF40484.1 gas vesicle protein GvpG [Halobacillus halophilus]CCG46474.1 gas vesicle protein GvpG [Halobacillus halophilus DSM 2266]